MIGKPCFAYFDVSGTFCNSNWPGIFQALIFYHEKHLEHKKSMREATRPKRAMVVWALAKSSHLVLFGPWTSNASIFISDWSTWPKNAYIKTPEQFPWGGGGGIGRHKIEALPVNIGGGNAARVALGCFSNLSDITNTATMMKREYSTSELWVCGSSLFNFSLMLWCLYAIWAAQHDCGAYYVIPMWWILILLDHLWDVICYSVLDVWVVTYCYPILCYLFWSNLYARTREGDGVY
jgi:hypothetical protein